MNNDDLKKLIELANVVSSEPPKSENPFKYYRPSTPYENTILKKMADDVKTPLEEQLEALQSIVDSAQEQAKSSKKAAEQAIRDSKVANKQARNAKIISIIAIIVPLVSDIVKANWESICKLFESLFLK